MVHNVICISDEKTWHVLINVIVHWAMSASYLQSKLKPMGLFYLDGKHPDDITRVPWRSGSLLVWDSTCPDTFTPSHLASTTMESVAVLARAN